MNKKQIIIFVAILFSIIITLFIISEKRKSYVYNELMFAHLSDLSHIHFYKDFLRNDGDLHLSIKSARDKKNFVKALKTINPSNLLIRSLNVMRLYRIRFNLHANEERLLTLDIHKTEETGNTGIITISLGDVIVSSAGVYESKELLQWIEKMEKKPGFEKIGGAY